MLDVLDWHLLTRGVLEDAHLAHLVRGVANSDETRDLNNPRLADSAPPLFPPKDGSASGGKGEFVSVRGYPVQ